MPPSLEAIKSSPRSTHTRSALIGLAPGKGGNARSARVDTRLPGGGSEATRHAVAERLVAVSNDADDAHATQTTGDAWGTTPTDAQSGEPYKRRHRRAVQSAEPLASQSALTPSWEAQEATLNTRDAWPRSSASATRPSSQRALSRDSTSASRPHGASTRHDDAAAARHAKHTQPAAASSDGERRRKRRRRTSFGQLAAPAARRSAMQLSERSSLRCATRGLEF